MKITFIENRYSTYLYELIAHRLAMRGHSISWIVQNHQFAPKCLTGVHCLPYPMPHELRRLPVDSPFDSIARIDRGIRYFGGNSDHYLHYAGHLRTILSELRPDIVFGESTQFHELMTVSLCREFAIPYLHPTATRIPHGRICFLQGDTLEAFGGKGEELFPPAAREIVTAVAQRKYAAFTNASASNLDKAVLGGLKSEMRDKLKLSRAWLQGERFITPSPLRKTVLEWKRRVALHAVRGLSRNVNLVSELPEKYVLYAMQMQPETNIDVWGSPWHDQARLIISAAQSLCVQGYKLVVKLNPTAKYELLESGLMECFRHRNVLVVSPETSMAELFRKASALISVTGSVIYEAIFSGKPVFVLGSHALSRLPGVTALKDPSAIGGSMQSIQLKVASSAEAESVIQDVVRRSYPGYWFDPVSMSQFATEQNLDALADAFSHVLEAISTSTEHAAIGGFR